MKYIFAVLTLFVIPFSTHAAATERLKIFIAATHSAQANFTQEVMDKGGKRIQSASGAMQFERPGKFRWEYRKPYEQIIVGDGKKFWMYDVDLNQVTVKKLDAALGGSPAALLAGSNEIEKEFALTNIDCDTAPASSVPNEFTVSCRGGNADGLEWLQAIPKSPESAFEKVLMAFNAKSELVMMELHDAFGHRTVLRFSDLKNDPALSPKLFQFVPPKDADVLGE